MALLRGRARLGALTLAYPHTPPFPSWGRFEEVRQSRCASMYELLFIGNSAANARRRGRQAAVDMSGRRVLEDPVEEVSRANHSTRSQTCTGSARRRRESPVRLE